MELEKKTKKQFSLHTFVNLKDIKSFLCTIIVNLIYFLCQVY